MYYVISLLSHIRHTTISYELAERLGRESDIRMLVVSFEDESIDDIEVDINIDSVNIKTLGAASRFDWRAISQLRQLLHDNPIDILHTHHNFVGSLGRLLAPRDLPIVDTEHADHHDHYSFIQNFVNAATLRRSNRVVANSQSTLNSFYLPERILVPEEKRRVIYNGIDLDWIDSIQNNTDRWKSDQPRVTTVGRLIPVKNHSVLIERFDEVLDRVPDAELVIVGGGPLKESLQAEVDSHGLSDSITLTGRVPRSEVYEILYQSDVFALPSDSEGFCVSLVEAMASGCAPVVSDIPVLHEVAGDTAMFVQPGDAAGFASTIGDLLSSPSTRSELASNAEQRARTVFPLERTVSEYRELYAEILNEKFN